MNMRSLTAGALSVAWVACGPGAKPPELQPLANETKELLSACYTTEMSRFSRGAQCPRARLLFVAREPNPREVVERMRLTLDSYGIASEPGTLHTGGQDTPSLSYVLGDPATPAVGVVFNAFAVAGSSESIEAKCFAYGARVDANACKTLLDAFVAQGLLRGEWPSVLSSSRSQEPLMVPLPGRDVRLPSACEELAPFE